MAFWRSGAIRATKFYSSNGGVKGKGLHLTNIFAIWINAIPNVFSLRRRRRRRGNGKRKVWNLFVVKRRRRRRRRRRANDRWLFGRLASPWGANGEWCAVDITFSSLLFKWLTREKREYKSLDLSLSLTHTHTHATVVFIDDTMALLH